MPTLSSVDLRGLRLVLGDLTLQNAPALASFKIDSLVNDRRLVRKHAKAMVRSSPETAPEPAPRKKPVRRTKKSG